MINWRNILSWRTREFEVGDIVRVLSKSVGRPFEDHQHSPDYRSGVVIIGGIIEAFGKYPVYECVPEGRRGTNGDYFLA